MPEGEARPPPLGGQIGRGREISFARAIAAAACLVMSVSTARAQGGDESLGYCPTQKLMADVSASPRWTDWGIDLSNTRFQLRSMAGLSV